MFQGYLYGCSIGDEVSYTAAFVCVEEACISSIGTVVEPSSVRSQADMATPLCRICACVYAGVCVSDVCGRRNKGRSTLPQNVYNVS